MNPKEKADQLIRSHLTAIAEETMDSDGIILYNAKQCALVTVDEISKVDPRFPYPWDVGLKMVGIYDSMTYPLKYWGQVRVEIIKWTENESEDDD